MEDVQQEIININTFISRIEEKIEGIAAQYQPGKVPIYKFVWVFFVTNIVSKSKDVVCLYENRKQDSIISASIIARSILEDFFYLRFILLDNIDANIDARNGLYEIASHEQDLGFLKRLKKGIEEDFFIPEKHDGSLYDLSWINEAIKSKKDDILKIKNGRTKEGKEYLKNNNLEKLKIGSIHKVCNKFDELTGRSKKPQDISGAEKSLRYWYAIVYKRLSGVVHQNVIHKQQHTVRLFNQTDQFKTSGKYPNVVNFILLGVLNTVSLLYKKHNV